MELGLVLLTVALLLAFCLAVVGVGYLAVHRHFREIPLSRWSAVASSSFVAVGLGAAWMTLGFFGLAVGQSLRDPNTGSLIRQATGVSSERLRLRLLLSAIFLAAVIFVAAAFLASLSGTKPH